MFPLAPILTYIIGVWLATISSLDSGLALVGLPGPCAYGFCNNIISYRPASEATVHDLFAVEYRDLLMALTTATPNATVHAMPPMPVYSRPPVDQIRRAPEIPLVPLSPTPKQHIHIPDCTPVVASKTGKINPPPTPKTLFHNIGMMPKLPSLKIYTGPKKASLDGSMGDFITLIVNWKTPRSFWRTRGDGVKRRSPTQFGRIGKSNADEGGWKILALPFLVIILVTCAVFRCYSPRLKAPQSLPRLFHSSVHARRARPKPPSRLDAVISGTKMQIEELEVATIDSGEIVFVPASDKQKSPGEIPPPVESRESMHSEDSAEALHAQIRSMQMTIAAAESMKKALELEQKQQHQSLNNKDKLIGTLRDEVHEANAQFNHQSALRDAAQAHSAGLPRAVQKLKSRSTSLEKKLNFAESSNKVLTSMLEATSGKLEISEWKEKRTEAMRRDTAKAYRDLTSIHMTCHSQRKAAVADLGKRLTLMDSELDTMRATLEQAQHEWLHFDSHDVQASLKLRESRIINAKLREQLEKAKVDHDREVSLTFEESKVAIVKLTDQLEKAKVDHDTEVSTKLEESRVAIAELKDQLEKVKVGPKDGERDAVKSPESEQEKPQLNQLEPQLDQLEPQVDQSVPQVETPSAPSLPEAHVNDNSQVSLDTGKDVSDATSTNVIAESTVEGALDIPKTPLPAPESAVPAQPAESKVNKPPKKTNIFDGKAFDTSSFRLPSSDDHVVTQLTGSVFTPSPVPNLPAIGADTTNLVNLEEGSRSVLEDIPSSSLLPVSEKEVVPSADAAPIATITLITAHDGGQVQQDSLSTVPSSVNEAIPNAPATAPNDTNTAMEARCGPQVQLDSPSPLPPNASEAKLDAPAAAATANETVPAIAVEGNQVQPDGPSPISSNSDETIPNAPAVIGEEPFPANQSAGTGSEYDPNNPLIGFDAFDEMHNGVDRFFRDDNVDMATLPNEISGEDHFRLVGGTDDAEMGDCQPDDTANANGTDDIEMNGCQPDHTDRATGPEDEEMGDCQPTDTYNVTGAEDTEMGDGEPGDTDRASVDMEDQLSDFSLYHEPIDAEMNDPELAQLDPRDAEVNDPGLTQLDFDILGETGNKDSARSTIVPDNAELTAQSQSGRLTKLFERKFGDGSASTCINNEENPATSDAAEENDDGLLDAFNDGRELSDEKWAEMENAITGNTAQEDHDKHPLEWQDWPAFEYPALPAEDSEHATDEVEPSKQPAQDSEHGLVDHGLTINLDDDGNGFEVQLRNQPPEDLLPVPGPLNPPPMQGLQHEEPKPTDNAPVNTPDDEDDGFEEEMRNQPAELFLPLPEPSPPPPMQHFQYAEPRPTVNNPVQIPGLFGNNFKQGYNPEDLQLTEDEIQLLRSLHSMQNRNPVAQGRSSSVVPTDPNEDTASKFHPKHQADNDIGFVGDRISTEDQLKARKIQTPRGKGKAKSKASGSVAFNSTGTIAAPVQAQPVPRKKAATGLRDPKLAELRAEAARKEAARSKCVNGTSSDNSKAVNEASSSAEPKAIDGALPATPMPTFRLPDTDAPPQFDERWKTDLLAVDKS